MKLQRTDDINLEASEIQTQSSTGIWKLVVLAMGFVMATLDTTVVNVVIADIQNSLEISFTGITWVVDGYILTFSSFWGIAEIHVILSHRFTFISKHNQIGGFSIILEPIITHPNHTIETKSFQ